MIILLAQCLLSPLKQRPSALSHNCCFSCIPCVLFSAAHTSQPELRHNSKDRTQRDGEQKRLAQIEDLIKNRSQNWNLALLRLCLDITLSCHSMPQDEGQRSVRGMRAACPRHRDVDPTPTLSFQRCRGDCCSFLHPAHTHLQRSQDSPASQEAQSLGDQALPSLQLGQASEPHGSPHPEAWTRLHRAHKAPPAEQRYWVKGFLGSGSLDLGVQNIAQHRASAERDWEHDREMTESMGRSKGGSNTTLL